MTLERFLGAVEAPSRSLVVVNRSVPRPVQAMLEETFADQPVAVDESDVPDGDADVVFLVGEGGEVLASSPLSALMDTILLVNSDLYRTGSSGIADFELPDVVTGLDGVPFRVRGYPESNKEKLLLIVISRYIERRALETGRGRHRASFQRLSRIDDERGTRAVYEQLAASPVETHVYGVPDQPPRNLDLTVHGGTDEDYRNSWFVVFRPDGTGEPAALLALETDPRRWEGYWTFDPDLVADIDGYIARNL